MRNELKIGVHVEKKSDPNVNKKKKLITEHELHVFLSFMMKICESITENKYWIGVSGYL